MKIKNAAHADIPALRALWKEAFGDTDAFLDSFFSTGFSEERSRCVFAGDTPAAALYWFDCAVGDAKIAYIYAVATASSYRGQGLCRALMDDTHAQLCNLGYAGTVLVPGETDLFAMYEKMGYRVCSHVTEFSCEAGSPLPIREISSEEYAALRQQLLPIGGIVQEKENLAFLQTQGKLFAGEGFLLAADTSGEALWGMELLGDVRLAPGIVAALGISQGSFRAPGSDRPFAMYLPLQETVPAPTYFGLAFD